MTPPPKVCPSLTTLLFANVAEGKAKTEDKPCKRLTCPVCGPRRRQEQAEHYGPILATCRFVARIPYAVDQWEALRKQLQRAKKLHPTLEHVRVPFGEGRAVVWVGCDSIVLRFTKHAEPTDMAKLFTADVANIPAGEHVNLSSSRAWSMESKGRAPREPAENGNPWTRLRYKGHLLKAIKNVGGMPTLGTPEWWALVVEAEIEVPQEWDISSTGPPGHGAGG